MELARYVVLNPVRAGIVQRPEDWPWCSYRATVGAAPAPPFLETDWLLRAFADSQAEAVARHRQLVAAGIGAPSPWLELKNQIYLGSETFLERTQALILERAVHHVGHEETRSKTNPGTRLVLMGGAPGRRRA